MFYNALTGNPYSPKNCDILAASFGGDIEQPVPVAGFHQWRELGRTVAKGEHGTKIYMVCPKKITDENGEESKKQVCKMRTVFFKSQTKEIE